MRSIVVAVVLAVALPRTAGAEKCTSQEAKAAFVEGKKLYDRGKFQEAVGEWEKAFDLCPSPDLLFNMAQAHRMLGNNEEAITLYRSWLRESPRADAALRKEIENRVSDLAALVAAQRQNAEKPPTGTVTEEAGTAGTGAPAPPAVAEPAGREEEPLDDGPVDGRTGAGPWYSDRWGWALTASGVVVVATGGGLLLHASGLEDDSLAHADEGERTRLHESANTFRTIGTVTMVAGGAILVSGVVKLLLHDGAGRERSMDVSVGPSWIGVSGTF